MLLLTFLQVVAFIKGTRTAPACGFSYKLLQILNETRVDFEVVNVLDEVYNPGLRDAIKSYSQWPTIPQVRLVFRLWCFTTAARQVWVFACGAAHSCARGADCASLLKHHVDALDQQLALVHLAVNMVSLLWGLRCLKPLHWLFLLLLLLRLQLYVSSEFVGGADIVEQMAASGELVQLLKQ